MTRGWVFVAVAGSVAIAADVVVSVVGPFPIVPSLTDVILHALIAAMWIAAGLVAWARRPELRIGVLMCAVGFAWLLGQPWWMGPLPMTIWYLLAYLPLAVGLHAVLAFPSGRLRSAVDRVVVVAAYADVLLGNLILAIVWDPLGEPCSNCSRNLLLIYPSRMAAEVVSSATSAIGVALGVVVVGVLVSRWRLATRAGRAVLGPVLWAGVLVLTVVVSESTVDVLGTATPALQRAMFLIEGIAVGLVPLAFLIGLLRARLRRDAMTGLMVELAQLPPAGAVRDALARALGDPSLRLVFWLPDTERYVGLDGRPARLPVKDSRAAVTVLQYGGERFGALVHDPFVLEDRTLLEAVGAAGRLAIENSRLQAQLRAQLEEVRASRARIVAAGDVERRRLERDLHDGAQQRLLAIRLALRLARGRVGHDDAEVRELIAEADGELVAGLDELRALARGIHPAVLTDEGLAAALAALARRSPVPVELLAVPAERLPGPLEAAAYFVASEALANVAKHAHASFVTMTVTRDNGRVRLEVSDDGTGGASATSGSGLSGLRDRVEALDGHLELTSPAGVGTTLCADFPCSERETPSPVA